MIRALSFLLIFLLFLQSSAAIREGTATADLFIKRYTHARDFARLALWHAAAAECLKRISVPMNEIAHDYYVRNGYETWATRAKKEVQQIQKQLQSHRQRGEAAWQKFLERTCNPDPLSELATETENIEKFITTWLPHYPDRFYEYGPYPTFFRKQRELAARRGDYARALDLEADAAEMCAMQYERIPIAYGLTYYEKHRDAYRRYASHLRTLAQQNPTALPSEIDKGREIAASLALQPLSTQHKADAVLQIAHSDARVKLALGGQDGVHAYPTFQGFAWIVSFSNHSRGTIAIAIIDEKTLKVLDVFSVDKDSQL